MDDWMDGMNVLTNRWMEFMVGQLNGRMDDQDGQMNGCKFGWIYVIGKQMNGIDGRDGTGRMDGMDGCLNEWMDGMDEWDL